MTLNLASTPVRAAILWAAGLLLSSVGGHFVVGSFLKKLRHHLKLNDATAKRTPQWIAGSIERCFFTIAVGINASDALTAMMAWLALKLAANWQMRGDNGDPMTKTNYTFSALMSGLVSMLIAFLTGILIRHNLE